jgi:HlyD family secretion protein
MKPQTDKQMPNQSDHHTQSSAVHRPRKKKRPWIVILLLIAVVGASGLMAKRITGQKSDVSTDGGTIAVQRGNLMVTVDVAGSIRAHNSIQYKCQVERKGGQVTIVEIVPAGTYITQEDVDNGKLLIKLDSSSLEDQLVQQQMTLATYEQNLAAAKEAHAIQVLTNESNIANQKQVLRFALLDLQSYLGVDLANELVRDVNAIVSVSDHVAPVITKALADPNLIEGSSAAQELKGYEDAIVTAQGALKNAQATLIGTQELYDANYVSTLELQQDELNVVNRKFIEESAHVSLDLFKEYLFPKQSEVYLSNYIEAGRELQRTYAQCRSQLADKKANLQGAELKHEHQDKQVKEYIEQIGYCTIRAKAPGLVIYGSGEGGDQWRYMRGRGMIAEGEAVWEGQIIISSPDTADMIAEIGVHETEVDKVRPGQPAEIVMDAFPDSVLQGEVLSVAPLPDQERGFLNPDLKVYKTLVKINGTHDFLKTRMSCRVQILVQRLEDVVLVPIQVVANRGGRKVCYVNTPQGPEEREVQTGAFNDTFTEITEGLEPGEEMLMNPPTFTEGVTDTTEADQQRFGGRKALEPGNAGDQAQGQTKATSGRREATSPEQRPEPGGAQFELPDDKIDGIMAGIKQFDPAKAKELEKLRKSNPDEFKTKLQEYLRSKMKEFGNRSGGAQGGRSGRPGQGEDGRNRSQPKKN